MHDQPVGAGERAIDDELRRPPLGVARVAALARLVDGQDQRVVGQPAEREVEVRMVLVDVDDVGVEVLQPGDEVAAHGQLPGGLAQAREVEGQEVDALVEVGADVVGPVLRDDEGEVDVTGQRVDERGGRVEGREREVRDLHAAADLARGSSFIRLSNSARRRRACGSSKI